MPEFRLILNFFSDEELIKTPSFRPESWWRSPLSLSKLRHHIKTPVLLTKGSLLKRPSTLIANEHHIWDPWTFQNDAADQEFLIEHPLFPSRVFHTWFLDPRIPSIYSGKKDLLIEEDRPLDCMSAYLDEYAKTVGFDLKTAESSWREKDFLKLHNSINYDYSHSYSGYGFSEHAVKIGLDALKQGHNVAFVRWLPTAQSCFSYLGKEYLKLFGLEHHPIFAPGIVDDPSTDEWFDDIKNEFLWPYLRKSRSLVDSYKAVTWRTGIECDSVLLWLVGGLANKVKIYLVGHGKENDSTIFRNHDPLSIKARIAKHAMADPTNRQMGRFWETLFEIGRVGGDSAYITKKLLSKRCFGAKENKRYPENTPPPNITEVHFSQCFANDVSEKTTPLVKKVTTLLQDEIHVRGCAFGFSLHSVAIGINLRHKTSQIHGYLHHGTNPVPPEFIECFLHELFVNLIIHNDKFITRFNILLSQLETTVKIYEMQLLSYLYKKILILADQINQSITQDFMYGNLRLRAIEQFLECLPGQSVDRSVQDYTTVIRRGTTQPLIPPGMSVAVSVNQREVNTQNLIYYHQKLKRLIPLSQHLIRECKNVGLFPSTPPYIETCMWSESMDKNIDIFRKRLIVLIGTVALSCGILMEEKYFLDDDLVVQSEPVIQVPHNIKEIQRVKLFALGYVNFYFRKLTDSVFKDLNPPKDFVLSPLILCKGNIKEILKFISTMIERS